MNSHRPPFHDRTAETTISLNARWRVRLDDPNQWILEVMKGRKASGGARWVGRSFCTLRHTLLRDIRERIQGDIDPEALRQVEALPEKFPYRKAKSRRVEIGVEIRRASNQPDRQRVERQLAERMA